MPHRCLGAACQPVACRLDWCLPVVVLEHPELSRIRTCISTGQPLAEHVKLGHGHQLWPTSAQVQAIPQPAFLLTDKTSHDTPNSTGDAVEMRNSRCIQQLILISSKYHDDSRFVAQRTGIFFWVMTTEVSYPLTETDVWPEPEIALNAYSKGEHMSTRHYKHVQSSSTHQLGTVGPPARKQWDICQIIHKHIDSGTGEYSNLSYDVLDMVWSRIWFNHRHATRKSHHGRHASMSRIVTIKSHHTFMPIDNPNFKTCLWQRTEIVHIYTNTNLLLRCAWVTGVVAKFLASFFY